MELILILLNIPKKKTKTRNISFQNSNVHLPADVITVAKINLRMQMKRQYLLTFK